MDCKAAFKRFEEGIPGAAASVDDSAKTIAETVQFFITAMDSLKLELTAVDQIYPLINDLYESLCKISSLPSDWSGKVKIKGWSVVFVLSKFVLKDRLIVVLSNRLSEMNKMSASDELNDEQVRQLMFDLDSAYTAFHKSLAGT